MKKFTLDHTIPCDAETFWKIFFDKAYNEALYREKLGFTKWEVLEQRETDASVYRKVLGAPKVDLPGPLAKMMGSSFSYTEEGTYDRKTGVWRWTMAMSAMTDKVHTSGTVRVEPAGAGKCRRISEISIEAKVFGVGGLIESTAEKNMREGWDGSAAFMNQWITSGKAAK